VAFCISLCGSAVTACAPDFPRFGTEGRHAEAAFENRTSLLRRPFDWAALGAELVLYAAYYGATNRYAHNVLGPLRDNTSLTIHLRPADAPNSFTCPRGVALPDDLVFEGVRPILADVSGDGVPEILTTISSQTQGARVSVFDIHGEEIAATPHIGTRYRWLGLIGAADLDGDGAIEIAYVDRPHLAKTLRVWRYAGGVLTEVSALQGLTNHKIGEPFISGGIRDCGAGPEIITADARWRQIVATRLVGGALEARAVAQFEGPDSFQAVLDCTMR
jgi:hypothetical protein